MTRRPWITWTTAALVGLGPWPGGVADRPARAEDGHGGAAHEDMFFTAPVDRQLSVRMVGDERFTDAPLTVSTKPAEGGVVAIIDGDMILGRRDELLAIELAQLISDAKNLDPDSPQLKAVFSPEQLKVLSVLRRMEVRNTALGDAIRKDAAEAQFAPLLARAGELIRTMPPGSGIPQELVDAVDEAATLVRARASIIVGTRYRWPNGVVPYFYDASTLSAKLKGNIDAAVVHWNSKTKNVLIRPTRSTDPYYIQFMPSDGCGSYVGKVRARGRQEIFLADACEFDQVVHEIGHALGLFHEQSRNDRDRFLTIQAQNAKGGTASNFLIPQAGTSEDHGPFDFASVMLYATDAFSANGKPTMVPTPLVRDSLARAGLEIDWGINRRRLRGLSKGDVQGVEAMYRTAAQDVPLASPPKAPFDSPTADDPTPVMLDLPAAPAFAPVQAAPAVPPVRNILDIQQAPAAPAPAAPAAPTPAPAAPAAPTPAPAAPAAPTPAPAAAAPTPTPTAPAAPTPAPAAPRS